MSEATLAELLERNAGHVDSLPEGYFDDVQTGQEPAVVSVCCADSRVSQEGVWEVEEPGWLFTPSTVGNQVWDRYEGEKVVDGTVAYPIEYTGTRTAVVLGHTGCGAVTAALEATRGDGKKDTPRGVAKWIEELVPVIEDGLKDDRVSSEREVSVVDQLVEYNVDRQVEFLLGSDEVPDDASVYGFVYDFQGVYGDEYGRAYLVNANGVTDKEALLDLAPEDYADAVVRLLNDR
jgi:carbonic anhydrase